jgi:hypothetical protein
MRTVDEDIMPAPDGGEDFPPGLVTDEFELAEIPSWPDDEEPLADLFRDVFELVDETVARVKPGEVERAVRSTLPVSRRGEGRLAGGSFAKRQRLIRGAVTSAAAGAWLAAFTSAGSVQLARFLLLVLAALVVAVVVTTWPSSSGRRLWPRKFSERPWRDGRAVLNIALRHMREVFVAMPGKVMLAPRAVELQMNPRDIASLTSRIEISLVNSMAEEHYQATILANAARLAAGGSVKVRVTADPELPVGRYRLRRDQLEDAWTPSRSRELARTVPVRPDLTLPGGGKLAAPPTLRLVTNGSVAETRVSGARAGRGQQVELQLPEESTVSRVHAEFVFARGQWRVIGKGLNGLILNGAVAEGEQVVQPGDTIRWGRQDGALVSRVEIAAGQGA